MQQLSLSETISEVEQLIEGGKGDLGRLCHILEFLKNNKPLYHSDQMYLENKLNSPFSLDEDPIEENAILPRVQELINTGKGDPGRLQHIYDTLANNKPLYHSDQVYLESKLDVTIQDQIPTRPPEIKKVTKKATPQINLEEKQRAAEKAESIQTIEKGAMPKGWSLDDSKEASDIDKTIETEENRIKQQQIVSEEITSKKLKLSELISQRKNFEEKISKEKSSLESEILNERIKIESQAKLSEEISQQKNELVKIQKERASIIKKIESEKTRAAKALAHQKRQLAQAQIEQEKIEKQVQNEQEILAKLASEQKIRLAEQAKMAREIKSKQSDLDKTKQDYEDIVSAVNEEKAKFAESEKLKKYIKTQEEDLIKAKESRLNLINAISKEKEIIAKKALEEKTRLKSQTLLTRQLRKEEKTYESLKKKREKIEAQIKSKNQKLKERQQRLKKQIAEKNKELKSLKSSELAKAETTKKPTKPKATKKTSTKPKKTTKGSP